MIRVITTSGALRSAACLLLSVFLTSCGEGLLPPPTPKGGGQGKSAGSFLEGQLPVAKPTIPVRWTLTDLDGRTVDATIVGKNATSITLVRTADGKRFELPLARLSESDQKRVGDLAGKAAPSKHPMESSLYRMKSAKLGEIETRIAELNTIYATSDSAIKRRSANSELMRLEAERGELVEELRELERY
jgi:hypothetical protein